MSSDLVLLPTGSIQESTFSSAILNHKSTSSGADDDYGITDLVNSVAVGAMQGFISLYDVARHPVDNILMPIGSFVNDARVLHACNEKRTNPTSYIARNTTFEECQPAVDRMVERGNMLKTFLNDFSHASDPKRLEILSAATVSSLIPGTVVRGGWRMANNYYHLGIFSNPRKFRNLAPEDLQPRKNATLSLNEFRNLKGETYHKFVITPDRQLYISKPISPAGDWLKHPDMIHGKSVIGAGLVYGKNGHIGNANDMSGHYQPYGPQHRSIVNKVFLKHGYKEAKNKFDDVMHRSFSSGPFRANHGFREPLFKIIPTPTFGTIVIQDKIRFILSNNIYIESEQYDGLFSDRMPNRTSIYDYPYDLPISSEQNRDLLLNVSSETTPSFVTQNSLIESEETLPMEATDLFLPITQPKLSSFCVEIPTGQDLQLSSIVPINHPKNSVLKVAKVFSGLESSLSLNPTKPKDVILGINSQLGKQSNIGVIVSTLKPKKLSLTGSTAIKGISIGGELNLRHPENSTVSVSTLTYIPITIEAPVKHLENAKLTIGVPIPNPVNKIFKNALGFSLPKLHVSVSVKKIFGWGRKKKKKKHKGEKSHHKYSPSPSPMTLAINTLHEQAVQLKNKNKNLPSLEDIRNQNTSLQNDLNSLHQQKVFLQDNVRNYASLQQLPEEDLATLQQNELELRQISLQIMTPIFNDEQITLVEKFKEKAETATLSLKAMGDTLAINKLNQQRMHATTVAIQKKSQQIAEILKKDRSKNTIKKQ